MKRKLIQQMRNEWRSNMWMMVEIAIVTLVVWSMFIIMGAMLKLKYSRTDYPMDNIYTSYIETVPEESGSFTPYPEGQNFTDDLSRIIDVLRNNPEVELVGLGGNALPYSMNYTGNRLETRIDTSMAYYTGNVRYMDGNMARIIGLKGLQGESSNELAEMLDRGEFLISDYDRAWDPETQEKDPSRWKGRQVNFSGDSVNVFTVGAAVRGFRRYEYEQLGNGIIIRPVPATWLPWEIAVKVRPGRGEAFMESLRASDLEAGNVYLAGFQSLDDRRTSVNQRADTSQRNMVACVLFLLVAVFLGFLGSFWFRTQQRVPELAIRKVNGATDGNIFRRLICEGLLLLAAPVIIVAILGTIVLWKADLSEFLPRVADGWLYAFAFAATVAVIGATIIAGVWMPARKAMGILPAIALHDK